MKLVTPLFLPDTTSLICITTLDDRLADKEFSELMCKKLRDENGDLVFREVRFSAVCDGCLARGVKRECPHKAHRLPRWQSLRKMRAVEAMMRDVSDDLDREIYGVSDGRSDAVVHRRFIDQWEALPHHRISEDVKTIYVCLDPNSGTHDSRATPGSDYAVVSGFETYSRFVVLGLESIDAHHPIDYRDRVFEHCVALRRFHAMTANSELVVIIENNGMQEAGWMQDYLIKKGLRRVRFMNEKELKVGCRTSDVIKRDMAAMFREAVMQGQLAFAEKIVTTAADPRWRAPDTSPDEVVQGMKDILLEQARRLSEKKVPPVDMFGEVRTHITGKIAPGVKDDVVTALLLLLYWMRVDKRRVLG